MRTEISIWKPGAYLFLALLLTVLVLLAWYWPRNPYLQASPAPWSTERVGTEPIILGEAGDYGYSNICCPTVLEVPDWVQNRLGRYYLYFARHKGSEISLAYSDNPTGPWTVHAESVLSLEQSGLIISLDSLSEDDTLLKALLRNFDLPVVRDILLMTRGPKRPRSTEGQARDVSTSTSRMPHISSPEVVIDDQSKRIVMFYHGVDRRGGQSSRIADSPDGLSFQALDSDVFGVYLRHFQYNGTHYLLGMPGILYRSSALLGPYEPRGKILFEPHMRHAGLLLQDDTLFVFWSRVGDSPEGILLSQVDLSHPDWNRWQATAPVGVLQPEQEWEGAALPIQVSVRGESDRAARELRDPLLFQDRDGGLYLYYVGGGEQAIGVAKLKAIGGQ